MACEFFLRNVHALNSSLRDSISLWSSAFSSQHSDIELPLSHGLSPRVNVDGQLLKKLIKVEVRIGFDFPKTTVTITQ